MKASWYKSFGAAETVLEVGDYPEPSPRSGEVKVRIYASGVNPSDTKKRAGANPALLDDGPVIPNSDGAGVIVAVGEGVSDSRLNERVWLYNGQYGRQEGTTAEFICLNKKYAVPLPENASFESGAMMGIPAMTAHRCVFADGPIEGQTILVTGGAGRVGFYAIQWAKLYGATVIATAGSEASAAECRKAGADLVVDHPSPEATKEILAFTNGQRLDRVVEGDFGVNLEHVMDIIKTSGVIATYSSMTEMNPAIPFVPMMFMDLTVRLVLVYAMPEKAKEAAIKDITLHLQKGSLINRIARSFDLEENAKAHEAIESDKLFGSVIVKI